MSVTYGIKPLSEVCAITGGGTPSKSKEEYYNDGDILWATVRDMNVDVLYDTENKITRLGLENSSSNIVPEGNVVIATRVGLGKVCLLNTDTAINQDLKGIIPKHDNLLRKYLFWWFKSITDKILAAGTGATVQGVKLTFINSLSFPHFPPEEQKQIVAILDQAFAAIDQAQANIQQNIQNAKDLFQSKLNQIFSQEGEGWENKTMGELGVLTSSKRIFKNEYVHEGIPFYRSKEIKELAHGNDISLELYITKERYEEIKSKFDVPKKGDILLTAVGTIGEMYIVKENDEFYFKDGNIMWLKNFSSINTYYLKYALISFVEQLKAMSQGSAYSALTIEKLKKYSVPIPSMIKQGKIVQDLDVLLAYSKECQNLYETKQNQLEELKKSLLQKAFSGERTQDKQAA